MDSCLDEFQIHIGFSVSFEAIKSLFDAFNAVLLSNKTEFRCL